MINPSHRTKFLAISLVGMLLLSLSCEFLAGTDSVGGSTGESDETSLTYIPATRVTPAGAVIDNPGPPEETVKLIFIHHSVGEGWLGDGNGGLGLALRDNNYFVSDTNYGWGPDGIGDRTDIGDWLEWFRGSESDQYLEALYTSNENYTGNYNRLDNPDPDRDNEVIMFKSCFPNSNLSGNPDDPPESGDPYSVGGAKFVYRDLLNTFASEPEKLFVVITAPPVTEDDSYEPPANARAFNNWLLNDWLAEYPLDNVAVFDFYNVLTSNDGDSHVNDLGSSDGNHHRWWEGEVQHLQTVDNDLAAYPTSDSHPNQAGNQKATAEFVPLLNVYYHRWQDDTPGQESSLDPASEPQSESSTTRIESQTDLDSPRQGNTDELIQPEDFAYIGAFRLPGGPPEIGWEWSGAALAYHPRGDPAGGDDDFPGSLFGTGHNWNQFISEVSIPIPVYSPEKNLDQLNQATTLQEFHDIRANLFQHLDFEIPRAGLAYLPPQGGQTSGKLHFCWGQHLQEEENQPTHGWSELDLANPEPAGAWFLSDFSPYSISDYLFDIPGQWAEAYAPGKLLATGRFRDGGWGGQGPSLLAYGPWNEGNPPPAGSHLDATPLLLYASTDANQRDDQLDQSLTMNGYHHSDEWSGGTWLTAGDRSAVIFAGTKGAGDCWYGFANGVVWPDEPPYPEVPDPPYDERGWWSSRFEGQILLYDPSELALVASGEMDPHEPQPYAALEIDPMLYHVYADQQKDHVGAIAFDRERALLFLLEPLADGEKSLVHVWQVGG